MQFVIWATDHPARSAQRQQVREAHRARLRDPAPHRVQVLLAGPTLDAAAEAMNGTLMVVEAASLAEVQAFVADDPYVQHGIYDRIDIRPWRRGLGPLTPAA